MMMLLDSLTVMTSTKVGGNVRKVGEHVVGFNHRLFTPLVGDRSWTRVLGMAEHMTPENRDSPKDFKVTEQMRWTAWGGGHAMPCRTMLGLPSGTGQITRCFERQALKHQEGGIALGSCRRR